MRQVPVPYSLGDYHSLNRDVETSPIVYRNTPKKWLAYYHAFVPKIGDFSTNYFNYLKIQEVVTILSMELIHDIQWYPAVRVISIIHGVYFALLSLLNDLLLFIPAEKCKPIYDIITCKNGAESKEIKPRSCCGAVLGFSVIYLAFAILSANGAVGILTIFPGYLAAQIFGAILAILGTELGVLYSHMVFSRRITEFIELMKFFSENAGTSLLIIFTNRSTSLQVIKSFSIISLYYTTMGTFYLYSLVEQLAWAFSFSVNNQILNIAMIIAGILVFLTNFVIRFPSVIKKSGRSRIDYGLEFLISCAGFIFSGRRIISNTTPAIWGMSASLVSLGIGLRAISLRPVDESLVSLAPSYWLTNWLNGHSRFIKSTFLPFAAISKVCQMLKTHSDIDLGFDTLDMLCLVVMMGIPIGINSSTMYKTSIDVHLQYLKEKHHIENETGGLFGKFSCLFVSSKAYPYPYQEKFEEILKRLQ